VYYLFSQGFRPGAYNRGPGDILPYSSSKANPEYQFDKPNAYRPDSLVNNEIGVKTLLLDDRLQLDVSAYAMRWDNVQMLFFNPAGGFGNTTFGLNGPSFDIKGTEIQAVARPVDGLTLQGSTSYNNDTQASSPCFISNVPNPYSYGQCITLVKGAQLANPFGSLGSTPPFSPKWEANFRARYDWEVASDFLAFVRAGLSYEDSMYNQPATYPSGTGVVIPGTTYLRYLQPAYTTFDGGFGVSHDQWEAEIFGENLGDSHASTFTSSAQFIKSEVPLRPRVIGIKVSFTY
jgi:iron complex outermembrane recepter protein